MANAQEARKGLVVLIRRPPLNGLKGAEGLRMAVGQALSSRLTVVLADAGVWLGAPLRPELVAGEDLGKHLSMLLRLGQSVWVEAESLERHGLPEDRLRDGLRIVSAREIERELVAADAVVVF